MARLPHVVPFVILAGCACVAGQGTQRTANTADKVEPAEVTRLIDELSKCQGRFLVEAGGFAPVDILAPTEEGCVAYSNPGAKAFKKLIAIGPSALPLLLRNLGNDCHTEMRITHTSPIGGLWILTGRNHLKPVDSYTVKVGDMCYAIVGRIANLPYKVIINQPTASTIICSPIENRVLQEEVAKSLSETCPQKLFDTLAAQVSESGNPGAAQRLLYYYPNNKAGDIILAKLAQLEDGKDIAHLSAFVRGISWCSEAKVNARVAAIFKNATEDELWLAALPGMRNGSEEFVFGRVKAFLKTRPRDMPGTLYGAMRNREMAVVFEMLVVLGQRFPDRAHQVYREFMQVETCSRAQLICHVLRNTDGQQGLELLFPLLGDKRHGNGVDACYYAVGEKREKHLPIRVCDEAALTIAAKSKGVAFTLLGSHEDLDKQIEVMRGILGK